MKRRPGRLIVATHNAGKLAEFRAALEPAGYHVTSLGEAGLELELPEPSESYEINAVAKAEAVVRAAGAPAIADDSGLAVDALQGRPGPLSSRFAGAEASDAERIEALLMLLREVPEQARRARFICVIALAEPGQPTRSWQGECSGRIAFEPRGSLGFGYDPVFIVEGLEATMAELALDVKNRISHRGRTLREMLRELRE